VTALERLSLTAQGARGDGPVVYWMHRSHRSRDNAALEQALAFGARWQRPVLVLATVDPDEPGRTERTDVFMLQGLRDVRDALRRRGVGFVCRAGAPDALVPAVAAEAAILVTERAYLTPQRDAIARVLRGLRCAVATVEADVVVPVEAASDKPEVAARTLRPKLLRAADRFLQETPTVAVAMPWPTDAVVPAGGHDVTELLDEPGSLARLFGTDAGVGRVDQRFGSVGGEAHAETRLQSFIDQRLARYSVDRGQPAAQGGSSLGMHLRFGQVSPVRVVLAVRAAARARQHGPPDERVPGDAVDAFVEQVLVRRELSVNFVAFTPDYERYRALPAWARATLAAHASDPRPHRYQPAALEGAETHDPYFNAAMTEMRETGALHGHMRMYWGKQLLAWSDGPEAAYETARRLNDRYFVDGRDPNSYAAVLWLFGLHDRPFPERPVFGLVRSMTAGGLERTTDPDAYAAGVHALIAGAPGRAERG
jgi:deoxyribodipyrimidine photo-lyase